MESSNMQLSANSDSKRVKFRIEFGKIENLQNNAEVFIKWGKTFGERTRIVCVKDNVADFTGESFQHELVLHRNKKVSSSWKTQMLTFQLCSNLDSKKDGVIGFMNMDLTRFMNSYQTNIVRPMELYYSSGLLPRFLTNHKNLSNGLLMPVLHYKVRCLWNEIETGGLKYPEKEQRERVNIVEEPQHAEASEPKLEQQEKEQEQEIQQQLPSKLLSPEAIEEQRRVAVES